MPVFRINWKSNGDFLADIEASNESEALCGIYKIVGVYPYPIEVRALRVHPENLSVHLSSFTAPTGGQPPDPEKAFLDFDCAPVNTTG